MNVREISGILNKEGRIEFMNISLGDNFVILNNEYMLVYTRIPVTTIGGCSYNGVCITHTGIDREKGKPIFVNIDDDRLVYQYKLDVRDSCGTECDVDNTRAAIEKYTSINLNKNTNDEPVTVIPATKETGFRIPPPPTGAEEWKKRSEAKAARGFGFAGQYE